MSEEQHTITTRRATTPGAAPAAAGFSLLEMLVAIVVLLIVAGGVFAALQGYQKSYSSTQLTADVYSGLRGAMALMSQEIGQAGSLSFASRTLTAAVTPSASAQAVGISSTSQIFVGESLMVDTGAAQEVVPVTAVGASPATVSGIFTLAHGTGAPVTAQGVFPQGILSSSSASELQLFGDVNGDGSLVYVQYDCNTTAGTLTRSSTPISASSISAAEVLVSGVVANPGGTACFQYTTATAGSYTFVTSAAFTLSVRTSAPDPQTGAYVTVTKSLLNLTPRNVNAGLALAQANLLNRLQATPPGLPLH